MTTSDIAAFKVKTRRIWVLYGILGALLFAYLISLIVRNANQQWTWLDGWALTCLELAAVFLCFYRGFDGRRGRAVPLFLGFALFSWTIGDFVLTAESLGGATVPDPSLADLFYLSFYPLAYIATFMLLQRGMGRLSRANWLDGVVAGLGAAALCAAFAFHSIE
ncbi:MAG TPA: hypothetical protein VMF33_01410, partial [Acidimicrobiales bacterium]|nr:hypothetical protein [Acidimicrobiales bacterium]